MCGKWEKKEQDRKQDPMVEGSGKSRNNTQLCLIIYRLRVVSNFGDGDCGAGEIHTRAHVCISRACVFRPPHNRHRQN